MAPKSNVPIRICGSKSRSGCKTCKQKHVKCDERQPICSRCQKANRPCIYDRTQSQTPQRTSSPNQMIEAPTSLALRHHSNPESPNPDIVINPYGPYEVAEVGAVKHFAAQLGNELAGYFSDDVWCHIIPLVSQHEPAIWHAVVAVSLLDSSLRIDHSQEDGSLKRKQAITHYGKAIQDLNTRINSGERAFCKDVILLSCLLFAIFESLQNHIPSALRHISGGLKLLVEWGREAQVGNQDTSGRYFDHTSLQPIFLSLDSQAVQLGAIAFRDHLSWPAMNDQWQPPTSFATVEEAHLSLNHIFNQMSHWNEWVGPDTGSGEKPRDDWMLSEEQRLRNLLAAWDSAFAIPSKILSSQPATILLLIQRKVLQTFFEQSIDGPSEMAWDRHLPLFQEALADAERFMKLTEADRQAFAASSGSPRHLNRPKPVFTVSMDIVLSLFLISAKCRDSATRRRALEMLKECNRREGIWDSSSCAMTAERMIEIEERGALENGFVPESARIYMLDIQMGEETAAKVTHKKLVVDEDGRHRTEAFEGAVFA